MKLKALLMLDTYSTHWATVWIVSSGYIEVESGWKGIKFGLRPCHGWAWLSTWLCLEWTIIQNWKAHLWSWSWGWEIQVSDLDLGMEILRHSGYESQGTKARIPLSSRSSGTKQVPDPGMVVHTFNLGATSSAGDLLKDLRRRKTHFSLPACTYLPAHLLESTSLVGLSNY